MSTKSVFDCRSATWLALLVAIAASGCTRDKYRLEADKEAYTVIEERNHDPRWHASDYSIEPDPRSRFFDEFCPDHSPMPLDDPASHKYMHVVDKKKGWKHWHDNGERIDLENPAWRQALGEYVDIGEGGAIKLDVDSALRLAYVNSPFHQTQLETMYLSALDVSAERFRLDTQFFGGYDTRYAHNGSLIPAGLGFVPALGRFVPTPAIDGVEQNRLTLGRPFAGNPALLAQRQLATAGELLVGFANSFVFEYTGGDANLAASLANFSFIQPLLRGAGRDIALEQLTFVERNLLANLRAYSQFRQGFCTQVAIGELGVAGPQRFNRSTSLQSFSGSGFVGGYLGLLQQEQRLRNTRDNLKLQQRSLEQLEAFHSVGVVRLAQVDQFRQSVAAEESNLLQLKNALALSKDRYKTDTLGLPPDVPIELDDTLIRQFQLVTAEATAIQDAVFALQTQVGDVPDDASLEQVREVLNAVLQLVEPTQHHLVSIKADLARMDSVTPTREQTMDEQQRLAFRLERQQLGETLIDLEALLEEYTSQLEEIHNGLEEETRAATVNKLVVWLGNILRHAQRANLVHARARLEAITVDGVELEPREAFDIALANRLDFMNGRAALVDSWRLIQFNADALQSVVNVTASGELKTARNNPVSFRAPTGNLRLGLEIDAPLTRVLERNAYRESLIEYQRDRRSFIQSRDDLHLGLRALLRDLEQLRTNLEIQRRAVAIAIRRVDQTREDLYAPKPPPALGARVVTFGSSQSRDLLESLAALRDSQNALLSVWLNYYATRIRLAREMGVMKLDEAGQWVDEPLPGAEEAAEINGTGPDPEVLPPPAIPTTWIEWAHLQQPADEQAAGSVQPVWHVAPARFVPAGDGAHALDCNCADGGHTRPAGPR